LRVAGDVCMAVLDGNKVLYCPEGLRKSYRGYLEPALYIEFRMGDDRAAATAAPVGWSKRG